MTTDNLAKILVEAWKGAKILSHDEDDCWRAVALAAYAAITHHKPKPQKARVKQPTEIIRALLDSGYTPAIDWSWHKDGGFPSFQVGMFLSCGREPDPNFIWKDEWLVTPVNIPAKDEKVMVRERPGHRWERRYSFGELNKEGNLLCYNHGSDSWTATINDPCNLASWEMWREPNEEELK